MINFFKNLGIYFNFFLNQNFKIKFYFLIFFLTVSNLLEIIGISLIIPIVHMALNGESILYLDEFIYNFSLLQFFEYVLNTDYTKQYHILFNYIIIFLTLILIKNIFIYKIHKFKFKVFSDLEKDLKINAMKKFLNITHRSYTEQSQAALLYNTSRVSDVITYFESIYNIFHEIVFFLFILISLIYFFSLKPVILLLFFILLIFIFLKTSNKKSFYLGKIRRENETSYVNMVNNMFLSYRDIKIYKAHNFFFNDLDNILSKSTVALKKMKLLNFIPKLYLEFIALSVISILFLMNLFLLNNLENLLPKLTFLLAILFKAIPSFNKFILNTLSIKNSENLINNIYNSQKSSVDDKKIKNLFFNKSILLKKFSFQHKNSKIIFKSCNFSIKKGDKIGIFGPSGSGKSTLLNLVLGYLKISDGQVIIDGKQIKSNFHLTNRISIVSQEPYILNDTILKNITLKKKINKIEYKKINKVLNNFRLNDFINSENKKLNSKITSNSNNVSGGQKQRIAIARAVFNNPDIILLDEPTSALDKKSSIEIIKKIIDIFDNKTIIFISHDIKLLRYCKIIYHLKNKKLFKTLQNIKRS